MKKIILLLLLLPLMGMAQERGISFEHGLSWQQLKEKAKKENKFIFVDCFTTWCGPCIEMAKYVFPREDIGTFYNENFINVKAQMDETAGDSKEVKNWRADATMLKEKYGVKSFPTFLFFSPEGELVHRMVGSGKPDAFIARGKKALDPKTQYYTLLKKYNEGGREKELLQNLHIAAHNVGNFDLVKEIVKQLYPRP